MIVNDRTLEWFILIRLEPCSSGYGRRLIDLKVVGSNLSTVYWMDILHISVVKIVANVCLKKTKRRPGMVHFYKISLVRTRTLVSFAD